MPQQANVDQFIFSDLKADGQPCATDDERCYVYYTGMTLNSTYQNEDDLLPGLNAGDEKALNLLFKKYYNSLCIFATQLVSNSDIAEELAVDAFHKLWDRRADFNNLQALKTFLYVCVRNAALNHLDKEQRRSKKIFSLFNGAEAIDEPIVNKIIYAEILGEIQREINELPEQCSKIIKMLYEQDMSPNEIAEELNISRNTVYSQKLRGIAILKKRLSVIHLTVLLAVIGMR